MRMNINSSNDQEIKDVVKRNVYLEYPMAHYLMLGMSLNSRVRMK